MAFQSNPACLSKGMSSLAFLSPPPLTLMPRYSVSFMRTTNQCFTFWFPYVQGWSPLYHSKNYSTAATPNLLQVLQANKIFWPIVDLQCTSCLFLQIQSTSMQMPGWSFFQEVLGPQQPRMCTSPFFCHVTVCGQSVLTVHHSCLRPGYGPLGFHSGACPSSDSGLKGTRVVWGTWSVFFFFVGAVPFRQHRTDGINLAELQLMPQLSWIQFTDWGTLA